MTGHYNRSCHVRSPIHQKAFEQMKAIIATDALLTYPNPDKPYNMETDTSDYQLGSVIK